MMLTVTKGPRCYEDIRTVANIQYLSFREACFEAGLLGDDKEYIGALKEVKDWASGHYLIKLFVTLLLLCPVSRPYHVLQQTWQCLADGILYQQRRLSSIPDPTLDNSTCNIHQGSELAELLK
ncbi:unnamed protein product [Cuscuta europaea]|uniref:Uncharacterized protein n=1 Tax=Cuscuta europaea TaxID=41803 RepID=A0A9P1EFJ5_CUSEU|nr:unnamed protein product [Cuscuta europaea]